MQKLDLLPDSCKILKDLAIGGSKICRSSLLIHTVAIPKERLYWYEILKLVMFMIPNILSGLGFGGRGMHSPFILQVQEDFMSSPKFVAVL